MERLTGLRIAGGVLCFCNSSVLCRTRLQSPFKERTWDDPGWRLPLLLVLLQRYPKAPYRQLWFWYVSHFSQISILTARQPYIFVQDASAISLYIQVNTALYFILVPQTCDKLLLALQASSVVILLRTHPSKLRLCCSTSFCSWPCSQKLYKDSIRGVKPKYPVNFRKAFCFYLTSLGKVIPQNTLRDIQGRSLQSTFSSLRMKIQTCRSLKKTNNHKKTPHNKKPTLYLSSLWNTAFHSCLTHLWER